MATLTILTITWDHASPAPVNGYEVGYREVGTSNYSIINPNPMGTQVQVTVPDGKDWEGYVRSDCGNGKSSPVNFKISKYVTIENDSLDISILSVGVSNADLHIGAAQGLPLNNEGRVVTIYATDFPQTVDLTIEYTNSVSGQHVRVIDSHNNIVKCESAQSGILIVQSVDTTGSYPISIFASDGVCN